MSRRDLSLAVCALVLGGASPLWAQALTGRGYVDGCFSDIDGAGCALVSQGQRLLVWDDGQTEPELMEMLQFIDIGTAVNFQGILEEGGTGLQRGMVLANLEMAFDDPLMPAIQDLQGNWTGGDPAMASGFRLEGARWQWAGSVDDHLAEFRATCGGDPVPDSVAVVLHPLADDDERAADCFGITLSIGQVTLSHAESGSAFRFDRDVPQLVDLAATYLGCETEADPAFCYLQAGRSSISFSQDDTPAPIWELVETLDYLAPVRFSGAILEGDADAAMIALQSLTKTEPGPIDAALRALQGRWLAEKGAGFSGSIEITDFEWLEMAADDAISAAGLALGGACHSDAPVTATDDRLRLSLLPFDPEDERRPCFRIDHLDQDALTLTDEQGPLGTLLFRRAMENP